MAYLAAFVLLGVLTLMASAQNLGDIRLTGNGATSTAGRLEVFYGDFGWGTVSYKSLDENFANVACQQLGYEKALSLNLAIKTQHGIGNTTWILLNGSRCAGNELHVLRCSWKNLPCLRCSHEDDTAIECSSTPIWNSPYGGQVRLSGSLPSSGLAEIFVNGKWENICYDNVQSYHADTVCRQLGYTNSKELGVSNTYSSRAWLRNFNCTTIQPCFTYCFNRNSRNDGCNNGQLSVSCEFKLNVTLGAGGSPSICAINNGAVETSCTTIATVTPTEILVVVSASTSASASASETPTTTCIPDKAKTSLTSKRTLSIIFGSLGGICCGFCTVCFVCCCRRRQRRRQQQKRKYHSIR